VRSVLHLQALESLLRHGLLGGERVAALQELNVLGLDLGNPLVVLSSLLGHVRQSASALVEVLAQVTDCLSQREQHIAQSLVFRPACDQLLFDVR
jgi:hypothetical protein